MVLVVNSTESVKLCPSRLHTLLEGRQRAVPLFLRVPFTALQLSNPNPLTERLE